MTHLHTEKLSLASRDREKEEQRRSFRKKTILILIRNFLQTNGLIQSAETLLFESKQAVEDYAVCDNIDFESILQDFETYHFLRYQKLPQIVRKASSSAVFQSHYCKAKTKSQARSMKPLSAPMISSEERVSPSLRVCNVYNPNLNNFKEKDSECDTLSINILNLPDSNGSEWRSMANFLMQDCCKHVKDVKWSDIVGHEHPKQLLKEAVIYPLKYNELFNGKESTWQSVLLYGPTGTGKTLLATVAATESKSTLFKVCVSTVVSKWRGESEKYVKVLFDLAKHFSPSVIFIDEIDALMSHRGADHEASRRMKTEFFLQMDELTTNDKFVVFIAATNLPWELDHAVLRRMEKRILVDLPDIEGRIQLFKKFLSSKSKKENLNFEELAKATENYSPADILLVCKEAKMAVIRKTIEVLESNERQNFPLKNFVSEPKFLNVLSAINKTKSVTTEMTARYVIWKESHGSQ